MLRCNEPRAIIAASRRLAPMDRTARAVDRDAGNREPAGGAGRARPAMPLKDGLVRRFDRHAAGHTPCAALDAGPDRPLELTLLLFLSRRRGGGIRHPWELARPGESGHGWTRCQLDPVVLNPKQPSRMISQPRSALLKKGIKRCRRDEVSLVLWVGAAEARFRSVRRRRQSTAPARRKL
jgi:hypothetical protein